MFHKEGKEKFLFTEKNNNIIFRMSVIFGMSFAHHLQCEAPTPPPLLLFSCKNEGKHCFWLINKILWIKSQPVVAYKSVAYKKSCKFAFQSFKHEKMTLPHGFIFVFILYLTGVILPKVQAPKRHKKGRMAGCIVAEFSTEGF